MLTSHGVNSVGQAQLEQIIYIEEKRGDPKTFGLYTLDSKKDLGFRVECLYAHGIDYHMGSSLIGGIYSACGSFDHHLPEHV